MERAQRPDKPWVLDPAYVIPLSIFIACLCTLSLTMGLYTYFNVPGEFISLNPTNVLATLRPFLALIAFYLLFFLGLFFLGLFFLGYIKRPPNRASTTQYLNLLAIFITLCAIFGGYYLFFYIGKSAADDEMRHQEQCAAARGEAPTPAEYLAASRGQEAHPKGHVSKRKAGKKRPQVRRKAKVHA